VTAVEGENGEITCERRCTNNNVKVGNNLASASQSSTDFRETLDDVLGNTDDTVRG
jgi:hypothetical protein